MNTVEEVRRLRLNQLKQEHGSWVALNRLLGQPDRDSTLSQCANASSGSRTSKPKSMGSPLARRLESVCKKEEGWMDTDPVFDGANLWPFDIVPVARIMSLSPTQRGAVQGAMLEALERLQRAANPSDSGGKRSAA